MPFGRQRLRGVVVDLAEASELPPERLAEPIAALGGPLPLGLVDLGLWVAREYCSTPSRGLELVLPPGAGKGVGARTELRATLTPRGVKRSAAPSGWGRNSVQRLSALRLRTGRSLQGPIATR